MPFWSQENRICQNEALITYRLAENTRPWVKPWLSDRSRKPRDCYDTGSYRVPIQRACLQADSKAHLDNPGIGKDQELVPTWAPNQLRHAWAIELRKHGLDMVKTILGHNKVETSQIDAEKDGAAAMELVSQVG
jgi:integrase